MSSLSDRVAQRLASVKMSQAELARAAKVTPTSISDWLSGKTRTIKGENLLRAAQALQCSPQWLASGVGPISPGSPSARVAQEPSVTYLTDKTISEAVEILSKLDRVGRLEVLQWLRGYAAGRKAQPPTTHGDDYSLAKN